MFATLALLGLLLPASASPVAAADPPATVPSGFQDRLVWSGFSNPTAVAFARDGSRVFVAEKNGRIKGFFGLTDTSPTLVADLSADVDNYWDRGLLGLTVDPRFTTGRPYLYALYSYNHILGNGNDVPAWGAGGVNDTCPAPPGGNKDGCVISGRLDRLTIDLTDLSVTATRHLITDWCQQFPSHSIGSLAFGPEGALYVSAGDGASFNSADYGQFGGTQGSPAPTPVNPCGDPANEGGALRAQDLQTSGDPASLDGAILRIDPDTGDAWPDNANAGSGDPNKARIIAEGLRNPFRITVRSDGSVWIGDVGYNDWEEIDTIPDPDAAPRNFGWPCYEGPGTQPEYQAVGLPICQGLSSVDGPELTYNHDAEIVGGEGCPHGSSAIAGLAFHGTDGSYPSHWNGLFFTDWARACIWFAPLSGGAPDFGNIELFAKMHPSDPTKGGAVFLGTTPAGDLIYTNLNTGEVRTITYGDVPVAVFVASPTSGVGPLHVKFDASGSADPTGQTLHYAWDLDGDGAYDDSTSKTPSKTYTASGHVSVGLKVTDPNGHIDTVHHTITVGSTKPGATIDSPSTSLRWSVGDTIDFSGHASDKQDGNLPASAFEWTLKIEHCPSNCHEHTIQTWDGVKSGSFDAPDHDYPSYLRLVLKVTDKSGLTDTRFIDLKPRTGTVDAHSDPPGIALSVGKGIGIVGSTLDVSAPATAVLGEETWAFDHWSDGGDRAHGVPVGTSPTHLTASYGFSSETDAPASCASARIAATGTDWRPGRLAAADDVDWYRFSVTSTRTYQVTLADLPADASLRLYRGCSTLVASSDRAGPRTEAILKALSPGTYSLRVAAKGTSSSDPYVIRFRGLSNALAVLSASSIEDGGAGTLSLVGEVWNGTTTTRGPIKVIAKLYDADGHLLTTRSTYTIAYATAHDSAPFRINGSLPAGFARAVYTVSGSSSTRLRSVTLTNDTFAEVSGRWRVTGTIKATAGAVRLARMTMVLYDGRGTVIDVVRGTLSRTTLAKNQSASYTAWSAISGLTIDKARIRASAFKP